MTRLWLVRADDEPPGAVGRVLVGQPERYAYVKDDDEFGRWAARNLTTRDCGHVPSSVLTAFRERVVREYLRHAVLPPPGMEIGQEKEIPLEVYPTESHGEEAVLRALGPWSSPAKVIRSRRDTRRRQAQRRRKWAR